MRTTAPWACLVVFLVTVPAMAVQYAITDLGNLGGVNVYPHALNAGGQVTGGSWVPGNVTVHAFLTTAQGMHDLGTLDGNSDAWSEGYDVNDGGQVVGFSEKAIPVGSSFPRHAFLSSGGFLHDLGTLGGSDSTAYGINNHGLVVGEAWLAGDQVAHAFLYAGGSMQDLSTLGGASSTAYGINDDGAIVGTSDVVDGGANGHAFLYVGGSMRDLGTLGGTSSVAQAINASGQIVGSSRVTAGSNDEHAFLYSEQVMRDLGTLGGSQSQAWHINAGGDVVGSSTLAGDALWHPFLYSEGAMVDLTTLLPAGSGWTISSAIDINDAGQITGSGQNPVGEYHAFLLTPVPEPAALSLLAVSGLSLLRRRR